MAEWPHNRNGCNSSGPQIMAGFQDPDYIYGIHILKSGSAIAFRWRESTNVYQTFDLTLVGSNALELPLIVQDDDHYTLVMGCDANEKLHIFGNHHDENTGDDPPHYVVCNNVSDFTNPASWAVGDYSFAASLDDSNGVGTSCYHFLDRLSDGTLIHFMSQSENRLDSQGRDWLAFKLVSGSWTPMVSDGHFVTTEDGASDTADRVYVTGLLVEGPNSANPDRVHVVGNWRTANTDANSSRDPYYLYSDNLSSWRNIQGAAQTMPLTWATRAGATISPAPAVPSTYRQGVCVDPVTGYPSAIWRDGATTDPESYVRLYWDGAAWQSFTLPTVSGMTREHYINGELWLRHNTTNSVALRRLSNGQTIRIGGQIKSQGDFFPVNPDPIRLREDGVYYVNIGDGDTPKIYSFGANARLRI